MEYITEILLQIIFASTENPPPHLIQILAKSEIRNDFKTLMRIKSVNEMETTRFFEIVPMILIYVSENSHKLTFITILSFINS